jgi:hypothetical protein
MEPKLAPLFCDWYNDKNSNQGYKTRMMRFTFFISSFVVWLIGCNSNPTAPPSVPPGFIVDSFFGTNSYDSTMRASQIEITIRYHYASDSGSIKHIQITTSLGGGISEGVRQYAPDPPSVVKGLHYKFWTPADSGGKADATVRATIEGWLFPIIPRDTSLESLFTWTDSIRVPVR